MHEISLKLDDLLDSKEELAYIIGPYCSTINPSGIPEINFIKRSIIEKFCSVAEIPKLNDLTNIKCECLLEILRNQIDPNLEILDFYNEFNTPNIIHSYVASLIRNGYLVMTTNHDSLIEQAYLDYFSQEKILQVMITEDDYKKFLISNEDLNDKNPILFKLKGCLKNAPKGEDTKNYLISNIIYIIF